MPTICATAGCSNQKDEAKASKHLGNHSDLTETKFGRSPVGSFSSYQLSHTESNFDVIINIDSVPRSDTVDHQIDRFPRFPLRNHPESEQRFLSDAESEFVKKFHLDEDEINTLEGDTREQANSQLWVSERKYRFMASNFHLISHRQRHHEKFANTLMHPKPFSKPFGLLEVKCPETKFLVSPLDACSDPSFCCESIHGKCKLKVAHPYYAQVQEQMGITSADWCDFVIFTKKGMSIEGVPFDPEYWQDLEGSCCFIIMHISLNML
ncbi:hypothetical protein P5673_030996 [Acropora cervicornis]|uniref:YqaJ viral recombinase domain-containing protein n=1 Tax=Acropora cervicornis TaxID=6130 RepID=A0AAD9UT58_ACRCE|nr:hypothetical protein P5673_030996 [Acropora cervicornis]